MKSNLRLKADAAKKYRCKNLIVVLENPKTIENIASTIRNIDSLGGEKLYVIDGNKLLPPTWEEMKNRRSLNKISSSAIQYVFVKTFENSEQCAAHLSKNGFVSIVTSPHVKGKINTILHKTKFTQKKLAIWFGNEGRGISDFAVDNGQSCVSIPMCGIIESLNLGTSTGIVLYEATRQRRNFKRENKDLAAK